jgi:hypothetical protein
MIEDKRKKVKGLISIGDIAAGAVFEFNNCFYIKINNKMDGTINAFNLTKNRECFFYETPFDGTIVKAKIVIED